MHKIVTIFLFMLQHAWVLIDLRLGLRMDFCSVPFKFDHDETYKPGYGPRTRVLTT